MQYKSFVLFFLLCCLGNTLWGQEQASAAVDFTDFKLENGLRVIVLNDTSSHRFSADLVLDYPLVKEGEYKGVGELVQRLLPVGTKMHTKSEIDSLLKVLDCSLASGSTALRLSAPSENKEAVLALLAELIQHPTFPEPALEMLKEEFKGDLDRADYSIIDQSSNLFNQLSFGADHPYGERVSKSSVANVTQETCQNFHRKYYRPIVAYLVIAGNIEAKEVRFLAEKYFGNWRGQGAMFAAFYNPAPLPESTRLSFVNVPSAKDISIEVGYAIPLRPSSEDVLKVEVLEQLVEARLAEKSWNEYDDIVTVIPDQHLGFLKVAPGVLPHEMAEDAIKDILDVLSVFRNQLVTKEALANAKASLISQSRKNQEVLFHQDGKAGRALSIVRFKLPRNYYNDYFQRINNITSAGILEVAREYLLPGRAHIIVAGDQVIAPSLARFAGDGKVHYYNKEGAELEMVEMTSITENVTAEGVIEKYLSAIGGRERLAAVTDFQMEAEAKLQAETMIMTRAKKNDEMFFGEFHIGDLEFAKIVFDGNNARILRTNTPKEITEEDLEMCRSLAVTFPQLRYQEEGVELKLTGSEVLNRKNVHSIEVTSTSGRQSIHYYDTRTGYLVRVVGGIDGDGIVTDFSDYRTTNGVKFPHQIIMTGGFIEESLIFQVTTLKVNQGVSDDLFKVE
ncbi:insulinase family protein [Lewinella cohaerens]|uniref:insulinase family protein n=1 Tax=Lewinella cohaerens TaxID=70995 RepID=UPI00036B2AE2|nr:insulinase family protein [Lewinella cohaerens]